MSIPPLKDNPKTHIEFKSYTESEDYLVRGTPEPGLRSQTLIHNLNGLRWWIKVTFRGEVYKSPKKFQERRKDFRHSVRVMDCSEPSLLDDTVTELILEEARAGGGPGRPESKPLGVFAANEPELSSNTFIKIAASLSWATREDPSSVVYPLVTEFPSFQHFNAEQLSDKIKICVGVSQVTEINTNTPNILKVVNRPFYQTHDTGVIREELRNLELFSGVPGIVQAAGVAVSINPYIISNARDQALAVTGIVLEFSTGGSLETLLRDNRHSLHAYPWHRWPLQIASAIQSMHSAGKAHLDIKPANIVLDADGNAILIYISGIGGMAYEWSSPEAIGRGDTLPYDLPNEVR